MFDLNTPEGLEQAKQTLAQTTVPKATVADQEPLTEQETIKIVQSWVTQDAEVELPERRTFEEMVSDLRDAAEYRGSNIPSARFEEIVKQYAPDAPHRNESPRKDESNYPSCPAD
jgi:hypothetical protein